MAEKSFHEDFTFPASVTRQWGVKYISVSPPIVGPFDITVVGPTTVKERFVQVVNSSTTPSYKTKRKFGFLPNLPYLRSRLTIATGSTRAWSYQAPVPPHGIYENIERYRPCILWPTAISFPSPDLTEIQAEIRKRIKGTTWNSPVAALEARKTATMVADTATRLLFTYRALRKGDLAAAKSVLGISDDSSRRLRGGVWAARPYSKRAFAKAYGDNPDKAATNAFLELRYGWGPLLADIHDAAKTLADRLHSPRMSTTKVSVRRRSSTRQQGIGPVEISPRTLVRYDMASDFDVKMEIRFSLDYAASAASAVGFTNPALVAWELVPFSFVADWFVPVGDFLSSIDATVGKDFHSGLLVQKNKHLYDAQFLETENFQNMEGHDQRTLIIKRRDILTTFPPLVFPPINPHGSISRMLSSIALLNQQIHKSRGR